VVDYKLEIVSVEGMSGYVILKVPSMKERLQMLKESGISGVSDGAGLETLIKMMDKLGDFVKEVNLKYEEYEFGDLETLGHYAFGMAAYTEIASVIMNGIPAGKKLAAL
jgi:hypothetical protein